MKQTKTCLRCGKEYTTYKENSNYCSIECRHPKNIVVCTCCGKEFHKKKSHADTSQNNFCSNDCHYKYRKDNHICYTGVGEESHKWKGGKKLTEEGYYEIYEPEHPRSLKQGGQSAYVREHILIAEECLGRFLTSEEVVHHIDFDKTNNNPLNLYVFLNGGEHTKYHHSLTRGENVSLISNLKSN